MAKDFTDYVKQLLGEEKPKRAKNPAKRKGTAKPNRPSQITKKPPTKRLVARRKRNTDPGYFPNPGPVPKGATVLYIVKPKGANYHTAVARTLADAKKIAMALANETGHPYIVGKEYR